MALMKGGSNLPKEAVVLEEHEAISHQWKQVFDWPKHKDVWAFRYGLASLSGTAALTATYILKRHRAKLKLRNYGYVVSVLGVMFAPAVGSAALHTEFISNDILLSKTPCPVCLQTRAVAIQVTSGVLYPFLFSSLTCSMMALRAGIRIPHYRNPLELLKMWWKISKHMMMPLSLMTAAQIITAIGITYFEAKQVYELQETLLAYEEKRRRMKMNSS